MSDSVKTIDDDKVIGIAEAIEHFGLSDHVWRRALKTKALTGGRSGGPGGWLFRAGDARAYAKSYLGTVVATPAAAPTNLHPTDPTDEGEALTPKEPT